MEITDLRLPLFDRDFEVLSKVPDPIRAFRQKLGIADVLLFSFPEHTYGIPGPLKNALDWGVRDYGEKNLFKGKICGVIGVGMVEKPKYYSHLKDWAKEMNMDVLDRTLYVNRNSAALNAFNHESGELVSDKVERDLQSFVMELLNEARTRRG